MKNQENPKICEQGGVLLWVLICVALLAGLAAVLSQGSRTGEGTISRQQRALAASEIIAYGNSVRDAVRQVRMNGCTDTQISFQSADTGADYQNTNAPDDLRCHIFHPEGGGLKWMAMTNLTTQFTANTGLFINGKAAIPGVGTTCTNATCNELILFVANVPKETCDEINKTLNNAPLTAANSANVSATAKFTTAQLYVYDVENIDSPHMNGKIAGCFQSNASGGNLYHYAHVLIAR